MRHITGLWIQDGDAALSSIQVGETGAIRRPGDTLIVVPLITLIGAEAANLAPIYGDDVNGPLTRFVFQRIAINEPSGDTASDEKSRPSLLPHPGCL